MAVTKAKLLAMIAAARDARERAYAPYSGFRVGAAVAGESGKAYTGCNVENASFGLSICAERVAIHRAVAEGESHIQAVVVVGGDARPARPCGACLQTMQEFSRPESPVVIVAATPDGSYDVFSLSGYLPKPFALERDSGC